MNRDLLLPPVTGVGVGLGIAAALAAFPGGTWTIAGAAGVVVGGLAWAAIRVLPHKPPAGESAPAVEDDENWVDDGSGERPVWSGHNTRGDLSPFSAWAQGDTALLDPDPSGVMPVPTWETPESEGAVAAGPKSLYRPRHRAKAGAR